MLTLAFRIYLAVARWYPIPVEPEAVVGYWLYGPPPACQVLFWPDWTAQPAGYTLRKQPGCK